MTTREEREKHKKIIASLTESAKIAEKDADKATTQDDNQYYLGLYDAYQNCIALLKKELKR